MTTTKTVITTRVMTQYKTKIHTMTILTISNTYRDTYCVYSKKGKDVSKKGT